MIDNWTHRRLTDSEDRDIRGLLAEAFKAHGELKDLEVVFLFRSSFPTDKDGKTPAARIKKIGPTEREFIPADVMIVLNWELWTSQPDIWKIAVLDHELTHVAPSINDEGERRTDAEGRPAWRIRDHEVTEFLTVIHRRGAYTGILVRAREELNRGQEPIVRRRKAVNETRD
jgi:hypothetical protein